MSYPNFRKCILSCFPISCMNLLGIIALFLFDFSTLNWYNFLFSLAALFNSLYNAYTVDDLVTPYFTNNLYASSAFSIAYSPLLICIILKYSVRISEVAPL